MHERPRRVFLFHDDHPLILNFLKNTRFSTRAGEGSEIVRTKRGGKSFRSLIPSRY